jgi:hypothetical protein
MSPCWPCATSSKTTTTDARPPFAGANKRRRDTVLWGATTVMRSRNKPIDTVNVASLNPWRSQALRPDQACWPRPEKQGRSSGKNGDGKHVGIVLSSEPRDDRSTYERRPAVHN